MWEVSCEGNEGDMQMTELQRNNGRRVVQKDPASMGDTTVKRNTKV